MNAKISLMLGLLFTIISCNRQSTDDNVRIVSFVESQDDIADKLDCTFIPLETKDDCLFSDVRFMRIEGDTIYLIENRADKLFAYGLDGHFIGQIGQKGGAPGEYIAPVTFRVDREKSIISVVDRTSLKLLHYQLPDFKYIRSQKIPVFSDCCWLPDEKIAWVHPAYETDKRSHYNVKITDLDLVETAQLYETDFTPEYLITAGRYIYESGGEYFLNFPFEPHVYKISSQAVEKVYTLDFGKYKFASLDWLLANAQKNYSAALLRSEYISACNVFETDDYIAACFYSGGANSYLAFQNKKTKESYLLSGTDFIRKAGLDGMAAIKGTYKDYFVATLYPSAMKRGYIRRPDLRALAENVSEEDNPILCLFKFK